MTIKNQIFSTFEISGDKINTICVETIKEQENFAKKSKILFSNKMKQIKGCRKSH